MNAFISCPAPGLGAVARIGDDRQQIDPYLALSIAELRVVSVVSDLAPICHVAMLLWPPAQVGNATHRDHIDQVFFLIGYIYLGREVYYKFKLELMIPSSISNTQSISFA